MRRASVLVMVAMLVGLLPLGITRFGPTTTLAAEPDGTPAAEPTTIPTPSEPVPSEPVPSDAAPSGPAPTDPVPPTASPTPEAPLETPPEPVAVDQATTVWITGLTETAVIGTVRTLTVVLSPDPAGGAYTLKVDGTEIGSAPATANHVAFEWTPTTLGVKVVTAEYSGGTGLLPSTSYPRNVDIINPSPAGVTVDAAPRRVQRNATVQLSATVSPDPGPGTVEFSVDDVVVGRAPLSDGIATYDTAIADPGRHWVDARFLGNDDWAPRSGNLEDGLWVLGDTLALDLTIANDPVPAGPVTLTATLGADPGGGTIHWAYRDTAVRGDVAVGPGGVTQLNLGTLPASDYTIEATFSGYGPWTMATDSITFTVATPTATTLVTNRTIAYVGELPVILTATVDTDAPYGTTVTFLDTVSGSTLILGPVVLNEYSKQASFSSSALRAGVHSIVARYDAGRGMMPSLSSPVTVTVGLDTTVHATFKPSLTTFYPYKDSFRDSVSLGGVLSERATVTVRVYSSSKSLKRTLSLGWKNPGSFAATWNGRTSSGAAVASGKYTVKASFKDVKGHTRTITAYTTVSWRQAKWVTGTAQVKYGDQLSYFATPGANLYLSDDYSRGRILDAGAMNRNCDPVTTCEEIFGGATFQMKSGVLDYRNAWVRVVGHGFTDAEHPGTGYVVNPTTLAWERPTSLPEAWDPSVVYNILPARSHISSTAKLKVVLDCTSMWGDAFDIHYLRLTYQYAVWK